MDNTDSFNKEGMGNKTNVTETLLNLHKVFNSPELIESLLNKTLLIELYIYI